MSNVASDWKGHPAASPEAHLAPLAAAGLAALTAVLAAYLARPRRRWDADAVKRRSLIAYLRDHLSGSDVAIQVVRRLASTKEGKQDGGLFRRLSEEFDEDRAIVRLLLAQLGASPKSLKRVAGYASGAALRTTAGGEPGDLSLLRTFEALSIGIQGKRCLWRALQHVGSGLPRGRVNFTELEAKALRQWEAVEERRRRLAATTFPTLGS